MQGFAQNPSLFDAGVFGWGHPSNVTRTSSQALFGMTDMMHASSVRSHSEDAPQMPRAAPMLMDSVPMLMDTRVIGLAPIGYIAIGAGLIALWALFGR